MGEGEEWGGRGRRGHSQDSRSRRSEEGIPLVVTLAARSRQKGALGGREKEKQTRLSIISSREPSIQTLAHLLPIPVLAMAEPRAEWVQSNYL